VKFIADRRYFLERFLRKLAKYEYLINSEEFKYFSRPSGDIEKMLLRIVRFPTLQLVEKIRSLGIVNEQRIDIVDKENFKTTIATFRTFAMKVLPQLKQLKKIIESFMLTKD